MQLIDPAHPFYRPLWRRIAIVAMCAGWFAFELFLSRDPLFTVLTGAVTVYSAWMLLANWKEPA